MPRDYKPAPKRRRRRAKKAQAGHILPFFSGLAIGLFVAFLVYLKADQPPQDTESRNPRADSSQAKSDKPATKPRFDFYTILPEQEVKAPKWEEAVPEKELPQEQEKTAKQEAATERYALQLGSFKRFEDADRIKATLALQGLSAHIERVVINGDETWYRVRLGPFANPGKLERVRSQLKENGQSFITLRLDETGH